MFHLVDKFFSWRKTYIAEDDNQREIFRVVKKMACELPSGCDTYSATSGLIAWDPLNIPALMKDVKRCADTSSQNQNGSYFHQLGNRQASNSVSRRRLLGRISGFDIR